MFTAVRKTDFPIQTGFTELLENKCSVPARQMPHLPRCQTGSAHQVPAGLDLHIFVVLCTDLAELKSGAHLTVQLVLLLQG